MISSGDHADRDQQPLARRGCRRACGARRGPAATAGSGRVPERSRVRPGSRVAALMRGLLRAGSWVVVALGVGGELEEQVLEAGALGGPQLDERDAAGGRDLADLRRPRRRCAARRRTGRRGCRRRSSASSSDSCSTAFTNAPRVWSSSCLVPCATIRPCPMRISSSAIFSTSWSRWRGQQHGAAPRRRSRLSRPRIQWMPAGSRPLAGSSRIRMLRVAEQRVRDAEALPHARASSSSTRRLASAGASETSSSISSTRLRRQPHRLGADGEDLAAGAAVVLGRGVEQHADVASRVREVGVAVAADRDAAAGGRRQPDHDAHRGGLAGAVRAEEAGDPARLARRRTRRRRPGGRRSVLVSPSTVIMRPPMRLARSAHRSAGIARRRPKAGSAPTEDRCLAGVRGS